MKKCDLVGKRIGKLKVVAELQGLPRTLLCLCTCGEHSSVLAGNLKKSGGRQGCRVCSTFRKRPFEALYNRLLRVAKESRKRALSYKEFLEFTKTYECHYCGDKVFWTKHFSTVRGPSRYNLDRKDNTKDYRAKNLVVCCRLCNFTKGDRFTYEQFIQIGKVIRSFR